MKINLITTKACFVFTALLLTTCSEEPVLNEELEMVAGNAQTASASSFDGVNWADGRDNYVDGWIIPCSINAGDSWTTIRNTANAIFQEFKDLQGVNTVRVGINPPTVLEGNYWDRWIGIVQAAQDKNMKIVLGCWDQKSSKDGKIDDGFYDMWDVVIDRYKNADFVYFEIMNEPFGYSKNQLRNLCADWINRYPEIPKGRILVPGTGYSENVKNMASDSRFNGCLFSQHIYPWYGGHTSENAWKNELKGRVGSSYKSRTIVTEFGVEMTTGYVYQYPISGSRHEKQHKSFLFGVPNQIRDWNMGSIYWPGVRDGDWYRLFDRNGTDLTKTNESGAFQVWWSYNK